MALSRIHCHLNLPFPSDAPRIQFSSLPTSSPTLFTTTKNPFSIAKRRSSFGAVKSQMTMEDKPLSQNNRMLVYVPAHPLIKHWVSVLRNEQTPCPIFRNAMAELGRLLIYEASRDWLVIPILRAGLALAEHASSILPATKTYHLGISRNEETLQPTIYLNKLPDKFAEGAKVFVVDPMLATGGTIVAALNLLKERGVGNKQIKVASCVYWNN